MTQPEPAGVRLLTGVAWALLLVAGAGIGWWMARRAERRRRGSSLVRTALPGLALVAVASLEYAFRWTGAPRALGVGVVLALLGAGMAVAGLGCFLREASRRSAP